MFKLKDSVCKNYHETFIPITIPIPNPTQDEVPAPIKVSKPDEIKNEIPNPIPVADPKQDNIPNPMYIPKGTIKKEKKVFNFAPSFVDPPSTVITLNDVREQYLYMKSNKEEEDELII